MEQREEKNARMQAPMIDRSVSFEANGELLLPDYLGEISRLLRISPTVYPAEQYINGANAEFVGRLCFDVLYAGADGRLYCAQSEEGYAFSVPTDGESEYSFSVDVMPEVVVGRVAAPRKLTLRCKLRAHVAGFADQELCARLAPEIEDRVCMLGAAVECGRVRMATGEQTDLYGEIETRPEEELGVIAMRAEPFVTDVSAIPGGVRCRGEVIATLLCSRGGTVDASADAEETDAVGPAFTLTQRIPLECEVPLEGAGGADGARARVTVSSLHHTVESGRISLAMRVLPQVEVQSCETLYYTKDLFMPHMKSECRYVTGRAQRPRFCANRNYSVSDSFARAALLLPAGAAVVDAHADAEVKETRAEGKSTLLIGEVHCHILHRQDREWGTCEATVPFRVSVDGQADSVIATATAPICRVQEEGARVRVDAELLLSLRGSSEQEICYVEGAAFEPRETERRTDLEFCCPAAGESLWALGRRYALDPAAIARANGLDVDDFSDSAALGRVQYLMMPQGEEPCR